MPQLFSSDAGSSSGRYSRLLGILLLITLLFTGCATVPKDRSYPSAQLLRDANRQQSKNPTLAVGLYLNAAQASLALLTDKNASSAERAEGRKIYNSAVAECVTTLQKLNQTADGSGPRVFQGRNTTYKLKLVSTGDTTIKNPSKFDRFIDSIRVPRKHLRMDITRDGVGGTLVAMNNNPKIADPNRPPSGFAQPVTAIAAFGKNSHGDTPVDLSLFDPRTRETITLQQSSFPLRGDFSAPLVCFPRVNTTIFGIVGMFRSDRVDKRSGIYFCEPYDPKKIPVLFVHGLMSSPHTWIEFVNELNSNPEFRRRYQAWVYLYPSGGPIAANGYRLRRDFAALAARYPLKKNIILIGHSMGGIISRMQVTNTRRDLWNGIFKESAKEISAKFPEDSPVKKALIFKANPYIVRVIFIATPHKGSNLATLRISSFASSFIRLPAAFLKQFNASMKAAMKSINPSFRSTPNSIIGLSPKNPLLQEMSKLPIAVPHNSIIGNRGLDKIPLAESSDGVVPYWSSHLPDAESEIIVPTGHDAFNNPRSVAEVLRILKIKH